MNWRVELRQLGFSLSHSQWGLPTFGTLHTARRTPHAARRLRSTGLLLSCLAALSLSRVPRSSLPATTALGQRGMSGRH